MTVGRLVRRHSVDLKTDDPSGEFQCEGSVICGAVELLLRRCSTGSGQCPGK